MCAEQVVRMSIYNYVVVLLCFLNNSMQISLPEHDSYVAAVVEYSPTRSSAANLQNYLQYIQQAAQQDADIIVFPELTLTRSDPIVVPIKGDLLTNPIPGLRPDLYHEVLVSISNAASENKIYVVINFEEIVNCTEASTEQCPEEKVYYFNTNVVFDRSGTVIDRYRKINLFGERTRTPALQPDLGDFDTDFGVTFGHFICFDLLYQVPALQVVEKRNITDVIFPTLWFSELPYLNAVQIQEAYAYEMNVNFLASGGNNVHLGSAGSGIFSGKAGALISTMPGLTTSRLLVSKVPKVPGQVTFPVPGPIYDPPTDHDSLTLISDPSIPSHTTWKLEPGFQEITLVGDDITCTFRINLDVPVNGDNIYKYRAAVFSGVRSYSGVATGGVRICSVFACTGETIDTCAKRFPQYQPNSVATFSELSITATVITPVVVPEIEARDTVYYPVSVDSSIMPLEPDHYTYTEDINGNVTVYTMVLKNNDKEIYSFAVWGRLFAEDGLPDTPPLEETLTTPDDTEFTTEDPDSGSFAHLLSEVLLLPAILALFKY